MLVSGDGSLIASVGDESFVRVWDATTGREVRRLEGAANARFGALAPAPDGRRVAAAADGTVLFWDLTTGTEAGRLAWIGNDAAEAERTAGALALHPDGATVAVGTAAGAVWVLSEDVAPRDLRRHEGPVTTLAFTTDGDSLASGSADRTVRLWKTSTGAHQLSMVGHEGALCGLVFAPGGRQVLAGGIDGMLRVFARSTGVERGATRAQAGPAAALAASADAARIAMGHRNGTVSLWDAATRKETARLVGHSGTVSSLAFAPDGRTLVSGGADRTVRVWDLARDAVRAGPRELRVPLAGPAIEVPDAVVALSFAPDSRTLAVARRDRILTLWDARTGASLRRLDALPRIGAARLGDVRFAPRGEPVELWWDRQLVVLREVPSGERRFQMRLRWADTAVAVSPGLDRIAVGTRDGNVRLHATADGEEQRTLEAGKAEITALCFARGGARLAALDERGVVRVWSLGESGAPAVVNAVNGPVVALALSPDGRRLALAGAERTVLLHAVADGRTLRTYAGHEDAVISLAFSPDGRLLASGGVDATVVVWSVPE